MRALLRLLDILIPRFITEDVAVKINKASCHGGDGWHDGEIVCSMRDVEPGEVFDGIVPVRSFNLFGYALCPKLAGPVRKWVNPLDKVVHL